MTGSPSERLKDIMEMNKGNKVELLKNIMNLKQDFPDYKNIEISELIAEISYDSGEYDQCIQTVQELHQKSLYSFSCYYYGGLACIENNLYDQAQKWLECILYESKKPEELFKAWKSLGLLYFQVNKWKSAIECFKRALKIQEDNKIIIELTKAYYKSKNYREIIELCNNIKETSIEIMGWKIKAYSKLKRFNEGYQVLEQLSGDISPRDRAKIAILRDELDKASERYNIEIKLAKRLIEDGLKYETEEEIEKSIESYKKAIELDPRDPLPYYNLGVIYSRLGKTKLMHEVYEQALLLKPDYDKVLYNLGCFYGQQKQPEKAIEYYKKALDVNPEYGFAIFNMAYEYEGLGNHEKAILSYMKYSKINPNDPSAFFNIAWNYKKQNKIKEAIYYYFETIKVDPTYAKAFNNLGVVFEELNEKKKALGFYMKAVELDPKYSLAKKNVKTLKEKNPGLTSESLDENKIDKLVAQFSLDKKITVTDITRYYTNYQHSRPVQKEAEIYDYEELLIKGIKVMKTGDLISIDDICQILKIEKNLAREIIARLIKNNLISLKQSEDSKEDFIKI
ncbi:MAG: tetratricopeptide repeat protein [Candidatus Hodarchaeales archaeon]